MEENLTLYTRKSLNRLFDEFSREFNFPDFGFFEFRGNRHQGIIFRGFIVQYVKVTKTEAIWPLQLHCLQSISLKFGNVNNGRRLFANVFSLSLFSRDVIFRRSMKIRKIRQN